MCVKLKQEVKLPLDVFLTIFCCGSFCFSSLVTGTVFGGFELLRTAHLEQFSGQDNEVWLLKVTGWSFGCRGRDQQAAMERMQIGSSWYNNRTCRRFGGFLGHGSFCCFLQVVGCWVVLGWEWHYLVISFVDFQLLGSVGINHLEAKFFTLLSFDYSMLFWFLSLALWWTRYCK